ncbi:hypothetical protein FOZ63_027688, partial [Perkinsus olseni]
AIRTTAGQRTGVARKADRAVPDMTAVPSYGSRHRPIRQKGSITLLGSKTKGASRTSDPREARDVTTWAVPEQKKCKTESQIMAYELDDGAALPLDLSTSTLAFGFNQSF